MTNTIQKRFKVSSTQLLYQSSPYQALTLFITGPFLDGLLTNLNVFSFKYTPQVLVNNTTRLFFVTFYFFGALWPWIFFAGIHFVIMSYICLCQLQYISCNWKNITHHLSSLRTSENLPCLGIWVCFTSWSI